MLNDRSLKPLQVRPIPNQHPSNPYSNLHRNPNSNSKVSTAHKLLDCHFSLKPPRLRNRRNSANCRIASHQQILAEIASKPPNRFQPIVLKQIQVYNKTRRWPLGQINIKNNTKTPKRNDQEKEGEKETEHRVSSARKFIQPKVLRSRVFSSQKKRRIFSADQRKQLPLIFTFGKQDFN